MANDSENNLIEVRTFATMEEIQLLPEFTDENPVNKDNYQRIFGDYWFSDEVKCCREKSNGQLCGEGHKWGFVAQLKDGSITIVGNHCAMDKFGADARIKADRSKYLNEKRRRERLALLEDLLADKETKLAQLKLLNERFKIIKERIKAFSESLGPLTLRRLQDIARTGNTSIFVDAITYREYVDDNGEKQRERRVEPTSIGYLSGGSIFNEYTFQSIYSSMESFRVAYEKAESVSNDIKASEIESLTSSMGDFDRIEKNLGNLEKEETAFLENELGLLCYLVDDKAERYAGSSLKCNA